MFGRWSLKKVLVHLIAWNELDARRIETLKNGETFDWVYDWDKFNETEISKRKNLTWEEIYKNFVNSGFKLLDSYKSLPDKMWNKKFDPSGCITAVEDLKGMIGHYENEHIFQLKKVI